jgi:hypothetical protein
LVAVGAAADIVAPKACVKKPPSLTRIPRAVSVPPSPYPWMVSACRRPGPEIVAVEGPFAAAAAANKSSAVSAAASKTGRLIGLSLVV